MRKKELKFKVGQIYKMHVAHASHVLNPYYVEIVEVGPDYIVTNIPDKHSLRITKHSNWDYHIPRMVYMGMKATHGHLLLNQNIVHKTV